jgi:murein DD-endopeptidase MepM/ murein hydrolase activator NlpD
MLTPATRGKAVCLQTTKTRILVFVLLSFFSIVFVGYRAIHGAVALLFPHERDAHATAVADPRLDNVRLAAYQAELREKESEIQRVLRENETIQEAASHLAERFAEVVEQHRQQVEVFTELTSFAVRGDESTGGLASSESGGRGGPYTELRPADLTCPGLEAAQGEMDEMVRLTQNLQRLNVRLQAQRHLLRSTPLRCPIDQAWELTDAFGARRHPISHRPDFHNGIDMAAPAGTDVLAPADGVVTFVGRQAGYGRLVILNHGDGLRLDADDGAEPVHIETYYGHLRRMTVQEGQRVTRGQVLGEVGSSGLSTGTHLHYEIRIDGRAIDPTEFLLRPGVALQAMSAVR